MPYHRLPKIPFRGWAEYIPSMSDDDIEAGVIYLIDVIDNNTYDHYQGWICRGSDNQIINKGLCKVESIGDDYNGLIMKRGCRVA